MQFDPKSKGLTISVDDAKRAADYLLAAIHYFRKSHGLPLEGMTRADLARRPALKMEGADTCEYCLLSAAKALGINLGSERAGEIDVREHA
jgi:hypothetical protein